MNKNYKLRIETKINILKYKDKKNEFIERRYMDRNRIIHSNIK